MHVENIKMSLRKLWGEKMKRKPRIGRLLQKCNTLNKQGWSNTSIMLEMKFSDELKQFISDMWAFCEQEIKNVESDPIYHEDIRDVHREVVQDRMTDKHGESKWYYFLIDLV